MAGEFLSVPQLYPTFTGLVPGENPLSDDGRWSNDGDRPPLKVRNGDASSIHGTVEFVVNGSLYVAQAFTGNTIEVYGCTPASGLGAALESQRVCLWTDPDARTGYQIGHGGGISEFYFLRKYTNNAFTNPDGLTAPTRNDHPERLGLRITPTSVEGWGYYSGVWEMVVTSTDTQYRGTFFAALETEEQGGTEEVGFSCFGGGMPNRQQFFRWVFN